MPFRCEDMAEHNVATGVVVSQVRRRHRAREFLDFLKTIDQAVPADLGRATRARRCRTRRYIPVLEARSAPAVATSEKTSPYCLAILLAEKS